MRVGIHTAYRRHEIIRASLRLADFLQETGHEITLYSHLPVVPPVHARWDRHVLGLYDVPLPDWIKSCQCIIWPEPLHPRLVSMASKAGVRTILFGLWDNLSPTHRAIYRRADRIVCPSSAAADLFQENWKLPQVRHIPWDAGLPLMRRQPHDANVVRLLLVANDSYGDRTHPGFFSFLANLLHTVPWATVTILHTNKLSAESYRTLRQLKRLFQAGDRFETCNASRLTYPETLLLYGRHDLALWAPQVDGLALAPLEALSMGTPVLTHDVPPASEVICDNQNGILVPCELEHDWFGVPVPIVNWENWRETLMETLHRPGILRALEHRVRFRLTVRRDAFEAGWTRLLRD